MILGKSALDFSIALSSSEFSCRVLTLRGVPTPAAPRTQTPAASLFNIAWVLRTHSAFSFRTGSMKSHALEQLEVGAVNSQTLTPRNYSRP